MSSPNIPDIKPQIDLKREDVITLLLASVALEEVGLSRILNAEGEKIKAVLDYKGCECPDISQIKELNESVSETIDSIVRLQMLLQMKLKDILKFNACKPAVPDCKTSTPRPQKCAAAPCAGPITQRCRVVWLFGDGEGYTYDDSGQRDGIARMRASINLTSPENPCNLLKFLIKIPSDGHNEYIALYAVPSSLHVEFLDPLSLYEYGYAKQDNAAAVMIKGHGILVGNFIKDAGSQKTAGFSVLAVSDGRRAHFRIEFDLPGDLRYDSGMVRVISGNLKIGRA
jgi:hypothetical protein